MYQPREVLEFKVQELKESTRTKSVGQRIVPDIVSLEILRANIARREKKFFRILIRCPQNDNVSLLL